MPTETPTRCERCGATGSPMVPMAYDGRCAAMLYAADPRPCWLLERPDPAAETAPPVASPDATGHPY